VTRAPVDDNTLCNRYIIQSFPTESNFSFVDWESFAADIDHVVRFISACSVSYERFSKAIRVATKRHVLRGFRKAYIPGWNQDCENLYQEYNINHDRATANRLLEELNESGKKKP
jgi:hypothetical protein